jgi:hypothetical protein
MVYFLENWDKFLNSKIKIKCYNANSWQILPNLDMFRVLGQVLGRSCWQFLGVLTNLVALAAKSFWGWSPRSATSPKWKRNKRLMRTCEELSRTTFVAK